MSSFVIILLFLFQELFATALHLLESTSNVVRAKAFVLIYIIIQEDTEQLLVLCQSR